eukprot:6275453-Prymnesium_polylepis.1
MGKTRGYDAAHDMEDRYACQDAAPGPGRSGRGGAGPRARATILRVCVRAVRRRGDRCAISWASV